jgi:hypothetical protein
MEAYRTADHAEALELAGNLRTPLRPLTLHRPLMYYSGDDGSSNWLWQGYRRINGLRS